MFRALFILLSFAWTFLASVPPRPLGAAEITPEQRGAIEAIISALAIGNGFLPGSVNTRNLDPAMGLRYLLDNETVSVDRVMSNAFGFGGTNCSLVLGRA